MKKSTKQVRINFQLINKPSRQYKNLAACTVLTGLLMGCSGNNSNESVDAPKVTDETPKCASKAPLEGSSCLRLDERDVIIYTPDEEIKGIALFLHGAPGTPQKVSGIFDAKTITEEQQLLSASPQGSNEFWGWDSLNTERGGAVDTDFIVNLITRLKAENNITSDKVYVFGYSAGGFMGYKLACEIPEQISAVVSLAGQFRGDFEQCTTSTPVTIHHLHSPRDTDVPMNGRVEGEIQSVDGTLAHWRQINGCDETTEITAHPAVSALSNGTETKLWQGCIKPVRFSELNNVPHEAVYDAAALKQIYTPIFN
ncbi:hypothetical protein LMH66_11065 [Shewanella sp. 10N.7]|uniref:alpha/beta hydrolase family esterase n=1 Tax=Shewanella sp. 10N.7 TaxID=2885093 RepID=UPI001E3C6FC0|nr:hypothetical protein [Shewanella sp. 10N.7]MCC4833171.1 hypothetical protein [Shewanella sp. 10N.7]